MEAKKSQQVTSIGSKKELQEYLSEIEKRVIDRTGSDLSAMIALNQIMRLPNAAEIVEGETKDQMKDLWIKLKTLGIALENPPMLFGLPEDFAYVEPEEAQDPDLESNEAVAGNSGTKHSPVPKKKQPEKTPAEEELPH